MNKPVSRLFLPITVLMLSLTAIAQQQGNQITNTSPLAVLLQAKGILSSAEVASINQASSPCRSGCSAC